MKLYSDRITERDLWDAARSAGVHIADLRAIKHPRVRTRGWEVFLTGSSCYSSQAGQWKGGNLRRAWPLDGLSVRHRPVRAHLMVARCVPLPPWDRMGVLTMIGGIIFVVLAIIWAALMFAASEMARGRR